VAVEMNDTDCAPMIICRSQRRERRGVISAQRDDAWRGKSCRVARSCRDELVGAIELFEGDCVVQEGQGSVAAVDNLGPLLECVLAC